MARNQIWRDEYWVLLMQLYQKKPQGVKPMFDHAVVDLCLELHVSPQVVHQKMLELERLDTPRIQQLWQRYGNNPQRLNRAVKLLRTMSGFGNSGEFYEGVDVQETFEHDFLPLDDDPQLTPMMLIIILDEYFRLTPITMVPETPEVQQLARLMHISAEKIADIMDIYQHCDPYLNRKDMVFSAVFPACQDIWQRYGNEETEQLANYAEQLKAYFQ